MLFVEAGSPEDYIAVLSHYRGAAYPLLFLGAFFETLIPFSLVVYGELFFLAGSVLAGVGQLDIWLVATVLYAGGILGDNASYWLGRHYGMGLFATLSRWPLTTRFCTGSSQSKGVAFFRKKGDMAVFLARLSGPFSWFVPALAGAFQQKYTRFLLFNTLGVLLGIGEFLVFGYYFGNNLDEIRHWLARLGVMPLVAAVVFSSLFFLHRYRENRKLRGNAT